MKSNLLTLIISFTCLVITSCKNAKDSDKAEIPKNQYTITGEIEGLDNNTKIYLNRNNEIIDSTTITDNRFQFEGAIDEPDFVYLQLKDLRDFYTAFWLENHDISIKGKKSDRRNIKVDGGPTQKDANSEKKVNDSLYKILDNIQIEFSNPSIEKDKLDSLGRLQIKIINELRSKSKEFIKSNPKSFLSLSYLDLYKTVWKKDSVKDLYSNFSDDLKKSSKGLIIQEYLSLPEKPEIGEQFIDFELPDTTGNTIKVSDLTSKYTLIEFWAAWCGPCRQENPNLIRAYNTYKDKGFEIVGISLDKRKKDWIKAIQKDKLLWPQLSDLKEFESYPAMVYSINGIPYNFLIDENGVIVAEDLRGNRLDKKLDELFSKL